MDATTTARMSRRMLPFVAVLGSIMALIGSISVVGVMSDSSASRSQTSGGAGSAGQAHECTTTTTSTDSEPTDFESADPEPTDSESTDPDETTSTTASGATDSDPGDANPDGSDTNPDDATPGDSEGRTPPAPAPAEPVVAPPPYTGFAGSTSQEEDDDDSDHHEDGDSDDEVEDSDNDGDGGSDNVDEDFDSNEVEDSDNDGDGGSDNVDEDFDASSDDNAETGEPTTENSDDNDDNTTSNTEAGEPTTGNGATGPCDNTSECETAPSGGESGPNGVGCPEPASADADDGPTGSGPSSPAPVGGFGRIAVAADGNLPDVDDFGGTAMALAMLAHEGLQPNVVNYTYNNYIWESDPDERVTMREGALEGAERFGFDRSVFFDASPEGGELEEAVADLTADINASTADNELTLILMGPMETAWMALDRADPEARRHVRCVSHGVGTFNQTEGANHGGHTYDDVLALGCQRVQIPDQNPQVGRTDMGPWEFLHGMGDPNMEWLYERIQLGEGSIADAGMVFFVITGMDTGSRDDVRAFLTGPRGAMANPGAEGTIGGSDSSDSSEDR